jgi:hypothetical protein
VTEPLLAIAAGLACGGDEEASRGAGWPLRLASEVSDPLALDGATGGSLLDVLAPEESAALAEGRDALLRELAVED